jgi:hypothetical protein
MIRGKQEVLRGGRDIWLETAPKAKGQDRHKASLFRWREGQRHQILRTGVISAYILRRTFIFVI